MTDDADKPLLRKIAAIVAAQSLARDAPPGVRVERDDDAIRLVRVADGAATAWRRHERASTLARLVRADLARPSRRAAALVGGGVVSAIIPAFCATGVFVGKEKTHERQIHDISQSQSQIPVAKRNPPRSRAADGESAADR